MMLGRYACRKCKFSVVHVHGHKAQIPANKDQKILNIFEDPELNAFLAIPGNKCPNSEIAR